MSSSPEPSESALAVSPAAVRLIDVHRSMALFAEGIVGRPVRIEALEGGGPGWPWSAAVDDPLVVRLPVVMDVFESRATNRRAYRTLVMQQLNHRLLATAPNDRKQSHPLIAASAAPDVARELFSLFENWRVAAATKRIYPGAAGGIAEAMASALQALPEARPTPMRAVRLATLGSQASGAEIVDGWAATLVDPRATTDQSARAALAVVELIDRLDRRRTTPANPPAVGAGVEEQSHTKILLVISDGYPQDVDYGDDRRDRDYGLQDTARALEEARALGVAPFCVTIDPAGHDYLRTMCPDDRYLVIDDVAALPDELAKVYLSITRSP